MAFKAKHETLRWLELERQLPPWSRIYKRNTAGKYRNMARSKLNQFDIEIEDRLWSLWGNLHPEAAVFKKSLRGRQYLAIYVIACCAASVYHLMNWSAQLLDTIVINGNHYLKESLSATNRKSGQSYSLKIDCAFEDYKFVVHIQKACSGKLYCLPSFKCMNLSEALIHFFDHYRYGIVTVQKRAVAIGFCPGPEGGYFMYDCQAKDQPLFPEEEGASYLLRTHHLQVLIYCIVVTLNVPHRNIEFSISMVEMMRTNEK